MTHAPAYIPPAASYRLAHVLAPHETPWAPLLEILLGALSSDGELLVDLVGDDASAGVKDAKAEVAIAQHP